MKNNDKILLESLVKKYGKNGVKNAIKNTNESLSGSDYVEAEQIIKTLIDNHEQLNKLINKYGEPTQEFERILNVYDEYVLDVFYDILESDDYEWVVARAKRMAEDNEWENGTEASMLINFLTDVANATGININENNKVNKNAIKKINEDEDGYEDIILNRLSGKDPEPEITVGLTDESMQYFRKDFYKALNDVAQKWEFRYICPSDDDWFNTLKWFLKEFRNRNF